jgi:hypothetical protein
MLVLALALVVLALAGCGSDSSGAGSAPSVPSGAAPNPAPSAAPSPAPSAAPSTELVLTDADAFELARVGLEAWALGLGATRYQVDGCSRIDPATAECVTSIEFADNPANPQACTLGIVVVAKDPTVGVEEPTHLDPTTGFEIEEYALPSGGYGTYEYGDPTACEQAQYDSGF